MHKHKSGIKTAIIDLYDDYPNREILNFKEILQRYGATHNINLTYEVFDLRGKNEVPDLDFDLYISSGGPGSPVDSEGSEWERLYWNLIDGIEAHNQSAAANKKHVLFVCHSFQLMCRRLQLGDVTMRHTESFGIFPANLTQAGLSDPIFKGLADPFFIVDSREWQVINPNPVRFKVSGAQILALEQTEPGNLNPRAVMAVRYNAYFFGTQFHPEVEPEGMLIDFERYEKKHTVIEEYGQDNYNDILNKLQGNSKIAHTYKTIIPNFMHLALQKLLV
jgi:GMP synthase-like glutamine amidotransferase